jgi:hypothetical protein
MGYMGKRQTTTTTEMDKNMRESAVASHIRLDAAQQNVELWRNNTGAYEDFTGRWVRYGLCNDSKALNSVIKSSDLIGSTPVMITPEMVGTVIGVFTAIETKPEGWVFRQSDKRAVAQQAFHDIVKKSGGYAGFATSTQEFRRIIRR